MKKILFIPVFFIFITQVVAQKIERNNLPVKNLMNLRQTYSDTIWLMHRYDINEWKDGVFDTLYTGFINWYPNANLKSILWIERLTDTLYKQIWVYDDSNRIKSVIFQNPANGTLINHQKIDQFYNVSGWDSLYLFYTWSTGDSAWQLNEKEGRLYDTNGFNLVDSNCVWDGQSWLTTKGGKTKYILNDFENVLKSETSVYDNSVHNWVNSYKYEYFLTNDTTGEFNAYNVYYWRNNRWENGEKYTEVVLHNWQGWHTKTRFDIEHLILEIWDGSSWYYANHDSVVYDPYGGNELFQNYWDWDNNKWIKGIRVMQPNNEHGFRTLATKEKWNIDHWDTIWGARYFFEYFNDEIWRVMHYEAYDTAQSKWFPAYDHIYSEFFYLLNTPEIKKNSRHSGLRIIPNPSSNAILIELKDKTETIKTVTVYNMQGRRVLQREMNSMSARTKINIAHLNNGVYILNVLTKHGWIVRGKFIKQ